MRVPIATPQKSIGWRRTRYLAFRRGSLPRSGSERLMAASYVRRRTNSATWTKYSQFGFGPLASVCRLNHAYGPFRGETPQGELPTKLDNQATRDTVSDEGLRPLGRRS